MDLGHYTAGYKSYHKVAVPKKTDTLKPNFTINLLRKLARGKKALTISKIMLIASLIVSFIACQPS